MNKIIKIVSSMFLLFASASALAQTAGLMPMAVQQFFDSNGNPLASGTVTTYVVGTTTLKTTWRDAAETTPNTNPIVLDAGGKAIIYGDGVYRQVVRDRLGNLIWDAVTSAFGQGGATQAGDGTAVGTVLPWSGIIAPTRYVFAYGQELSRITYVALYNAMTLNVNVSCTSGGAVISGLSDTTQIPNGAPVEATCLPGGTTVVSKTASTVTVNNNANVTTATTARFFPWGNGNGTTTFNVPDLRGFVLAGRNNMGGTASSRLTSTYFSTNPNAIGAFGGSQSHVLTLAELAAHTHVFTGTALAGHTHDITASSVVSMQAGASAVLLPIGTTTTTSTSGGTPAGTNASTGSSTAFPSVQPTITMNYVIKVLPDINISTLNVVTSVGGMFGELNCGTNLACSNNVISVTNSGSGSIGQSVTASPYNAACDGVTNATTAIQNALNSGNKLVYIPPANTCLVTALTIPTNVTFAIYEGAILKEFINTGSKIITVGGDNVTILGPGTIDGNGDTTAGAGGIFCQTHSGLTIDKITFLHIERPHVFTVDCTKITITNSNFLGGDSVDGLGSGFIGFNTDISDIVIENNFCDRLGSIGPGGQTCWNIVGNGSSIIRRFHFTDNRCVGVSTGGSLFQACLQMINVANPNSFTGAVISNNQSRYCNYCFTFDSLYNSTVSGNTALDVLTNGYTYEASSCTGTTFVGNTAKGTMNAPGAMALINVANDCIFTGNTFENATVDPTESTISFAPTATKGSKNIVSNNTVLIAGGTGITVSNNYSIVSGNTVTGGATGINLANGTNKVITNNIMSGQSGNAIINADPTDIVCGNQPLATATNQNCTSNALGGLGSANAIFNVKDIRFGAKGDALGEAQGLTDGTITAGAAAFTSANATFASTDCTGGAGCTGTVNKVIRVKAGNTATISNATPGVITWNSHGLTAGTPIYFYTTGALPSPIVSGVTYYVIAAGLAANTFEISTTVGGAAINTTTAGSGTHNANASALLDTTITSFINLHSVGLAANAAGSYNSARFSYGTNDTIAIQAAVTAAEATLAAGANTGCVHLPAVSFGYIITSEISITSGACINGDVGMAPFGGTGSQLLPGIAIRGINIASNNPVSLKDIGITYPFNANANVAAILLDATTGLNYASIIKDVMVVNANIGLSIKQGESTTVDNFYAYNYSNIGVKVEAASSPDALGGQVINSRFVPVVASTPTAICVQWKSGGAFHFVNNACPYVDVGFSVQMQAGAATGELIVTNNIFDTGNTCISMTRDANTAQLIQALFNDNHCNLTTVGLSVPTDGTGAWITSLTFNNNAWRGPASASSKFVNVDTVTNFISSNNVVSSANAATVAFTIGSAVVGCTLATNRPTGTFAADSIGSTCTSTAMVATGTVGFTGTKTVRASGGAADCTLIYVDGILTAAGTC